MEMDKLMEMPSSMAMDNMGNMHPWPTGSIDNHLYYFKPHFLGFYLTPIPGQAGQQGEGAPGG